MWLKLHTNPFVKVVQMKLRQLGLVEDFTSK